MKILFFAVCCFNFTASWVSFKRTVGEYKRKIKKEMWTKKRRQKIFTIEIFLSII